MNGPKYRLKPVGEDQFLVQVEGQPPSPVPMTADMVVGYLQKQGRTMSAGDYQRLGLSPPPTPEQLQQAKVGEEAERQTALQKNIPLPIPPWAYNVMAHGAASAMMPIAKVTGMRGMGPGFKSTKEPLSEQLERFRSAADVAYEQQTGKPAGLPAAAGEIAGFSSLPMRTLTGVPWAAAKMAPQGLTNLMNASRLARWPAAAGVGTLANYLALGENPITAAGRQFQEGHPVFGALTGAMVPLSAREFMGFLRSPAGAGLAGLRRPTRGNWSPFNWQVQEPPAMTEAGISQTADSLGSVIEPPANAPAAAVPKVPRQPAAPEAAPESSFLLGGMTGTPEDAAFTNLEMPAYMRRMPGWRPQISEQWRPPSFRYGADRGMETWRGRSRQFGEPYITPPERAPWRGEFHPRIRYGAGFGEEPLPQPWAGGQLSDLHPSQYSGIREARRVGGRFQKLDPDVLLDRFLLWQKMGRYLE